MNKVMTWLTGAGVGAGLMYILDPARGNRRRALMRDQFVHTWHSGETFLNKASRDFTNRTQGFLAGTKTILAREEVSDQTLVERVRSTLGRVITHPSAITVTAEDGHVVLTGPILSHEKDGLLQAIRKVRRVASVEDRLQAHDQAGDVPGLQGQGTLPESRFELMQENWTPVARLLATLTGGTMTLMGMKRGGVMGAAGSILGLGLLARGIANLPMNRLVGVNAGRRAVDIHKTINVNTPVEEVFQFWHNYENFPRFMSNIEEVRDLGDGRSRWVVKGPAGARFEWEAEITRLIPNEVLAWRSLPGAVVSHAGIIHFEPNQTGGTQVDIQISYRPPVGAVGHAVASILGNNPKQMMDVDLARFKSLVEVGKTTTQETVTQEEVETR